LEFDFGQYDLETISGRVPPRKNAFMGHVNLLIPESVIGRQIFRIKYRIQEQIDNTWVDLGYYPSDKQYFLSVYPRPLYRVFVSRGLRTEDKIVGDPIAEMIREWGFETSTVGIEVQVPEEQVAAQVRGKISNADAVIAIVTPRYMDALTGLWRTLEWAHGEVGITFGVDKPLLILKDKSVSINGLPSYLSEFEQVPLIDFDAYNLDELRFGLSAIMPGFRDWIENKRRQEFFTALGKIVVGGLAVIGGVAVLSGSIGSINDSSKE
jgi:hypothetical protein